MEKIKYIINYTSGVIETIITYVDKNKYVQHINDNNVFRIIINDEKHKYISTKYISINNVYNIERI